MTISEKAQKTTERLEKFMDKHVYPNNNTYHKQIEDFGDNRWQVVPIIEDLKKEAKKEDLRAAYRQYLLPCARAPKARLDGQVRVREEAAQGGHGLVAAQRVELFF